MLLTSELVVTLEQALMVIGYYETRWMIDVFHKAWKSGCRMEERPFQAGEDGSCETVLSPDEWHCLHVIAKPGARLPNGPPSARWALHAIARLGGWYDTKKTGRIGWQTLWRGWRLAMQTIQAQQGNM